MTEKTKLLLRAHHVFMDLRRVLVPGKGGWTRLAGPFTTAVKGYGDIAYV